MNQQPAITPGRQRLTGLREDQRAAMASLRRSGSPYDKYVPESPTQPITLPMQAELRLRDHAVTILSNSDTAKAWIDAHVDLALDFDVSAALKPVEWSDGAFDARSAMRAESAERTTRIELLERGWNKLLADDRHAVIEWCATVTAAEGIAGGPSAM